MPSNTYEDLDKNAFKFFVTGEVVSVYHSDIAFLPSDINVTNQLKVEFPVDKVDHVVKHVLENHNTHVEEYKEESYNSLGNTQGLFTDNTPVTIGPTTFFKSRSGHSKHYKDFSELDVYAPCICSIESYNPKVHKQYTTGKSTDAPATGAFTHVFSYLADSVIHYTFYQDDDLLSVTYSLVSLYNCVEILYTDEKYLRVFDSWGISSIKKSNTHVSTCLLNSYYNTSYPTSVFIIPEFCLVNINDFDPVDFHCATKQGKRLLNQWMKTPLTNVSEIEKRLDIGEYFKDVDISLGKMTDLKRLVARIENKSINVDEMIVIYQMIMVIPLLIQRITVPSQSDSGSEKITAFKLVDEEILVPLESAHSALTPLAHSLASDIDFNESEIILNENQNYQELKRSQMEFVREMDEELEEIQSEYPTAKIHRSTFKISRKDYNASGKYTVLNMSKTGVTFTTKRLTNLFEQLTKIENKMQREKQVKLEQIRARMRQNREYLEIYNFIIALVDIYKAFSIKTITPHYSRPKFMQRPTSNINSKQTYSLTGMWHPALKTDPVYNDIDFSKKVAIMTGPNMGGKSTFIKTLSIVQLYAQLGCYVPADQAVVPVFDQISMRVGARDLSSLHMSTFMVEMMDLNSICRSDRFSLVLIDELGRGTSAIDGLSIIIAVKEYLEKSGNYSVITTHFSEVGATSNDQTINEEENNSNHLNHLNLRMGVHDGTLTYKVEEGTADDSFGIKIAQRAKFPQEVIEEATEYIKE